LEIDSNQLTTLDTGIFDALANLAYLNIGNNQLTTLDLNGLYNLQQLYLYNNQLSSLP